MGDERPLTADISLQLPQSRVLPYSAARCPQAATQLVGSSFERIGNTGGGCVHRKKIANEAAFWHATQPSLTAAKMRKRQSAKCDQGNPKNKPAMAVKKSLDDAGMGDGAGQQLQQRIKGATPSLNQNDHKNSGADFQRCGKLTWKCGGNCSTVRHTKNCIAYIHLFAMPNCKRWCMHRITQKGCHGANHQLDEVKMSTKNSLQLATSPH